MISDLLINFFKSKDGNIMPTLFTKRLIIRPINMKDAKDFYEYAPSPLVGPMAGWAPHENYLVTKQVIKNMIYVDSRTEPYFGHYVITLKDSGKMIGTIELYNLQHQFKAELGYALNPKYWGNGYAVEAAMKVLEYGFTYLNLKRIEAKTYVDNYQSRRVCEKIGMNFEGIAKKAYQRYDGKIFDEARYGITDEEYFSFLRKEEENEETSKL